MNEGLFDLQSGDYARYRPDYPAALFDWLADQAPARRLAWDAGCGTGQATLPLAVRFERVLATDLSAAQLTQAGPQPNVVWRVTDAADSGLSPASVDLVTVAQALHWFDVPAFHAEVKRVLAPDGVVAEWTYALLRIADRRVSAVFERYYSETLAPYWPPERKLVESGYRELEFPFEPIAAPVFAMRRDWSLEELLGYVRSWSATVRYRRTLGIDPLIELRRALAMVWPAQERLAMAWPLSMRVGRLSSSEC